MTSTMLVDYDLIGSPMLINGYLSRAAISPVALGKRLASGSPLTAAAASAVTTATSAAGSSSTGLNRDDAAAAASLSSPLAGERGLTRTATTLLDLTLTQDELRRMDEARRAQQRSLLELAARKKSGEMRQRLQQLQQQQRQQQLLVLLEPEAEALSSAERAANRGGRRPSQDDGGGGAGRAADDRSADEPERSDSPPFVRVDDSSGEDDEPAYDNGYYGGGQRASDGPSAAEGSAADASALRSNKSGACLSGRGGGRESLLARSYSTSWGSAAAAAVGASDGGGGGLGVRFGDGAALQNLYPSLSHVRLPGGKVERIDTYFARVLKDGRLFRDVATAKFNEYEAWARTSPPRPPAALAKDLPRERMESKSVGPFLGAVAEGGGRGSLPLPPPLGQISSVLGSGGGRARFWSSSAGDLLLGKTRAYASLARKLGYVDEQGRSVAAGRRRQNAATAAHRNQQPTECSADCGGGAAEYEPIGSDDEEYSCETSCRADSHDERAPSAAAEQTERTNLNLGAAEGRERQRASGDGRDADMGDDRGGSCGEGTVAETARAGAARQPLSRRAERERSRTSDVRQDAPYRLAVVTLRELSSDDAARSTAANGRRHHVAAAPVAAASRRHQHAPQPSGSTSPTAPLARSADPQNARPSGEAAVAADVGRLQALPKGVDSSRLTVDDAAAAAVVALAAGRRVVQSLSLPRLSDATAAAAAAAAVAAPRRHAGGREDGTSGAADDDGGSGFIAEKHFGRFSNPVCLCPKLSKETLSCMSSLRPFASAGLLANGHLFKCQLHARYA